MTISNTEWEIYELCGLPVHVKREDLCSPYPGPQFSKIRGVEAWLKQLPAHQPVGVLDTYHSKAGWAVAYLCQQANRPCFDFYPVYKSDAGLRQQQIMADGFGANLVQLKAGRSAILYHQAKKELVKLTDGAGIMIPNALKLAESVTETGLEVIKYTPKELLTGTWVVSISSGTIASGVLYGLQLLGFQGDFIAHMGYSRSDKEVRRYMTESAKLTAETINVILIDESYQYKDYVDISTPFPCNPYYDAKTWKWLTKNVMKLNQPIIFWNIGA